MLRQTTYRSPLGQLTLLGDDQAMYGVWFEQQAYFGAGFDLAMIPVGDNASLQATRRYLDAYFAGGKAPLPPLHFSGTPYRQAVQRALTQVPYGQTVTYSELAARISGHKPAPRAIGGAVGHNPLSLLVPCHRVVGKDGSLTGYAGGLARKKALLQLEGSL